MSEINVKLNQTEYMNDSASKAQTRNEIAFHMLEQIVSVILRQNENITLKQIKEGIGYGWYFINEDNMVCWDKNECNNHLWEDVGDYPF